MVVIVRVSPKCPKHSGLGIVVICPDIMVFLSCCFLDLYNSTVVQCVLNQEVFCFLTRGILVDFNG